MSQYEARISKNADGEFYALIVRIDRDGQASVIHGYKGRHFATMKAAKKSTDAYISKMYATNPARRIGTAHPKRKSEATKKTPTKRLVARRKRNTKAGYYPNPKPEYPYVLMQSYKGQEENICACRNRKVAETLHSLLMAHAASGVMFYIRG